MCVCVCVCVCVFVFEFECVCNMCVYTRAGKSISGAKSCIVSPACCPYSVFKTDQE